MPEVLPARRSWPALVAWALLPMLPFFVVGSPLSGLGVGWDLLLLAALVSWAGRRGAVGVSLAWALAATYSLALMGSRLATDEQLPLYDLVLLVKPLVVVAADLLGPGVYVAALLVALLPLAVFAGSVWVLRRLLPAARPAPLVGLALLLGLLPGSRALLPAFASDVVRSYNLAAEFDDERARRPHHELLALQLADDESLRPDVHIYVIESYGTAVRGLTGSHRWEALLQELDEQARAQGWTTAAGISAAPVHGGRSWIADASVLTGLHIATQSNYERATAMADRIPTLPSFFADRGYATILVRPSDRERPGVMLQNRFGFQHTLFFDDLHYTGPTMGWGHIPDQYTLAVAHDELIDPLDGPTFAFFHLATAHLPWSHRPQVLDDPRSILQEDGNRETILPTRTPKQTLRIQARRFTDDDGLRDIDRSKEQGNYVATVRYDIESIVRQVGAPEGRPRIVVFYGDHQSAFLARGQDPTVPVHVMATDPALLEPFHDAGFLPGLMPQGWRAVVEHRDLFGILARSAASTR